MTIEEMRQGMREGRELIQEEWAAKDEIEAADKLIEEGLAVATQWAWRDKFQCEMRKVWRVSK